MRKIIITVFINLHNSKYTVAGIQPLIHRAFLFAGALVTYIEESKNTLSDCLVSNHYRENIKLRDGISIQSLASFPGR